MSRRSNPLPMKKKTDTADGQMSLVVLVHYDAAAQRLDAAQVVSFFETVCHPVYGGQTAGSAPDRAAAPVILDKGAGLGHALGVPVAAGGPFQQRPAIPVQQAQRTVGNPWRRAAGGAVGIIAVGVKGPQHVDVAAYAGAVDVRLARGEQRQRLVIPQKHHASEVTLALCYKNHLPELFLRQNSACAGGLVGHQKGGGRPRTDVPV